MWNFKPVAALLVLATLPAIAPAADDVAVLRAELQALKDDYNSRVDALETRPSPRSRRRHRRRRPSPQRQAAMPRRSTRRFR